MREQHLAAGVALAMMLGMSGATARAKWSRIIEEQRRSGLSVKQFCEARGIPASSVFAWSS